MSFPPCDDARVDGAPIIRDGEWFHFVFTYDGTSMRSRIDSANRKETRCPGLHLPSADSALCLSTAYIPGFCSTG